MRPLTPTLQEAHDPRGAPRFYPYGEHPATYRQRKHLKALEAHLKQVTSPADRATTSEAMLHYERTIAMFEAGEYEAKLEYVERRKAQAA